VTLILHGILPGLVCCGGRGSSREATANCLGLVGVRLSREVF
jgi:hypothetical protein